MRLFGKKQGKERVNGKRKTGNDITVLKKEKSDNDRAGYDEEYIEEDTDEEYDEEYLEEDTDEEYDEEYLEEDTVEEYDEEYAEEDTDEEYDEEYLEEDTDEEYDEEYAEGDTDEEYDEEYLEEDTVEEYDEEYAEEDTVEEYDEEYAEEDTYNACDEESTEEYADEDYDEEYTAEEYDTEYGEDIYEEDTYDVYEIELSSDKKRKKRGKNSVIIGFLDYVYRLPVTDKVVASVAMIVFCCIVLAGTALAAAGSANKTVNSFADIGTELDDINVIGESGLLAMNSTKAAELLAESTTETETEESTSEGSVTVEMKSTSIVKDLKLKFVNESSDKLIASVPFEVEVTDPDGNTSTWTDDDMDGIIYEDDIEGGTYTVQMLPLDAAYSDYNIDEEPQSIDVKSEISYEQVDVTEEVKTESEVDVSVEDTAVDNTTVESALTDTVPFVESTTTTNGTGAYTEIAKSTITDPSESAKLDLSDLRLMSAVTGTSGNVTVTLSSSTASVTAGSTTSLTATATTSTSSDVSVNNTTQTKTTTTDISSSITWSSSNTSVATVSGGTITGISAGTATITATANGATASCTVTVSAKPSLTLNQSTLSVVATATGTITATLSPSTATISKVSSSNTAVATVTYSGATITVKGVKAGTATITVTDSNSNTATCAITVTATGLTLDNTTLSVEVGDTGTITATLSPSTATISKVSSSSTSVATVTYSGTTVTVKGVKTGTATITVTDSNSNKATSAITVVNSAASDTSTKLKDQSGDQVYVYENGSYRVAVYADYYNFDTFYVQDTETLYTGWQNIDGNMYYYLADYTYVTGTQVIQGAQYTFNSDGVLDTGSGILGIDVSKWNGSIDWDSVKNSGITYVIIRCGYRGSSTGALIEDPKFESNISGALAAGLNVGVYFFTQATTEAEAVEEASMVISQVSKYKITYPIFLDVEASNGRADGLDASTRTTICNAFCATISNAGYATGVYSNKTWFTSKLNASSLSYKIWLAQYASTPTYSGHYDMWQYSSTGSIDGISGNVDLNLSYLSY